MADPIDFQAYLRERVSQVQSQATHDSDKIGGGGQPPMPPADYYTKAEMDAKLNALAAQIDAKIDARANGIELKLTTEVSRLDNKIDAGIKQVENKIDSAVGVIQLAIGDAVNPIGQRLAVVERMNTIIVGAVFVAAILGALKWLFP